MAEDRALQITAPDMALSLAKHGAVMKTSMGQIETHPEWELLAKLPMRLKAGVTLEKFKVKDLLVLVAGHVVESSWGNEADVPLICGEVQLGWAEFEVVEQRLAVRITRMA